MTELEKAFQKMTPDQRKKAVQSISDQMGMPTKKKTTKKTTNSKSGGKKRK